jgi:uncharacterized protein
MVCGKSIIKRMLKLLYIIKSRNDNKVSEMNDMKWKYLTYTVLTLGIYTGLHLYIAWILSFILPIPYFIIAIFVNIFAYMYIGGIKIPALKTAGSLWFACLPFFLIVFPAVHLLVFLLTAFFSFSYAVTGSAIAAGLLFIVYWGIGLYYAYTPVIRKYTIYLDRVSEPFSFAVASDMHFGGLSGSSHVKNLVKHVNPLDADVIFLCGDIVDDDPEIFKNKNQHHLLGELKSNSGIFAVTGNHEYYGNQISKLSKILEDCGIRLLEDETVHIENIGWIIGRKDKTSKQRKSVKELIPDNARPAIVLDHQPVSLDEIEQAGADISLSGHTHRGQIWPFHLITSRIFKLDWGYRRFGNLHAFVSSGFGFWGPPIRIGSQSEIMFVRVLQK